MTKKDKNKQERKSIDNSWPGPKLVWNSLVDNSHSKFLIETKVSTEHHTKVIALFNQQKLV